ncbi:hypothetical protein SCYAM73S_00192 [Streptomyces cyaneofuscatus]
MKKKISAWSLRKNQSIGHQPWFAPSQNAEIGYGALQPPRNSVTAIIDTVTMWMYSASMNIANLMELYSVLKPPTRSPSDSGMSNGARLASPTIVTM